MCNCNTKSAPKKFNIDEAVKEFAQTYWTAGSNIVSIEKTAHGINVVVRNSHAAKLLPAKFKGFDVTVYQDLGPAGKKLILRDDNGNITGFQG